ncbi:hypothetical protein OC846_003739 [Tilletia horrida]|uniref:FAD-binding domain-containing protein n=1 Tax=Tilletia horrida TaxID=155126 RepID=A0AAN6JTL2_9BASI|nr:hypothetical protein OC845_003585 [Tilletia horrida]KAK0550259.1 hypothetical protein OC846_003739 [Tilletia horrida]
MQPLGEELISRSAASYERTFWYPLTTKDPKTGEPQRGITRTSRVQSFPSHMDIGDCNCTLGLQQGIIECGFLRDMERHGLRVTRPWRFVSANVLEGENDREYPVEVVLEKTKDLTTPFTPNATLVPEIEGTGVTRTIRTKYLIGADGGRSAVRKHLERNFGVKFEGDWVDTLWAAMDCVVQTTFPDIRKIAAIHSAKHGALYIFPRENNALGQPMVRVYTQVNKLRGTKSTESTALAKERITAELVQQAIQEIAYPYQWKFVSTEWLTCYPVGQRLVSSYSVPQDRVGAQEYLNHRILLAGDACHTHSPKAGQGMNTAIIDSFSLAWRLNLIAKGLGSRSVLLQSYHDERRRTGKQLIDFDAEYSALFSGEIPKNQPELANYSPDQLKEHFVHVQRRNAAFTTGAGVAYQDSVLTFRDPTALGVSKGVMDGVKLEPGMRLQPGWATRFVSSTPVRLEREIPIDAPGGFRIYILTGELQTNYRTIASLVNYLSGPRSFLHRFSSSTVQGLQHGAYNVRPPVLNTGLINGWSEETNPFFHILTLVRVNRFDFELDDASAWGPLRARIYTDDVEPGGSPIGDGSGDGNASVGGVHAKWGLPRGGVVMCRPDGYVGAVLPFSEEAEQKWEVMDRYFDGFLNAQ